MESSMDRDSMPASRPLLVAVGHLNAAPGNLLTPGDLAAALRSGSVNHLVGDRTRTALVLSIFTELSPALIARCAVAAGADLEAVDRLYRHAVAAGLPAVPAWSDAVECLA